jgi:ABC-type Na+ transport system ATPase subunit NatA
VTPAVSVSSLTKKYGEVAGKSTTIKTLADPNSGSARVAGYDVTSGRDTVRRNIGLLSRTSPWVTVPAPHGSAGLSP